jgi:hypothetical protein
VVSSASVLFAFLTTLFLLDLTHFYLVSQGLDFKTPAIKAYESTTKVNSRVGALPKTVENGGRLRGKLDWKDSIKILTWPQV